jgi:hypothetical protein
MKKYWFVRKAYGWGWTPGSWQGWATMGVYFGGVASIVLKADQSNESTEYMTNNLLIPITVLTIALLIITYLTGEKPKWQWGKEKNEKQKH